MKRLAFLAVIAWAVILASGTTAATPKSNWRALNEDLAPVNVSLRDHVGLFGVALGEFGTHAQAVFFGNPFGKSIKEATDKVAADVERIDKLMTAISADARKGIAILDSYPPEQCSVHFTGMEFTMFAAWVTTMAELRAGSGEAANAAIWLGGFSSRDLQPLIGGGPIDLEWNRVKCQGASPSPEPSTATESPTPS